MRENTTSANPRLRASAYDAWDASTSSTSPATSAIAARRRGGTAASATPANVPASTQAISTLSRGCPS